MPFAPMSRLAAARLAVTPRLTIRSDKSAVGKHYCRLKFARAGGGKPLYVRSPNRGTYPEAEEDARALEVAQTYAEALGIKGRLLGRRASSAAAPGLPPGIRQTAAKKFYAFVKRYPAGVSTKASDCVT